ncbi:hypothetical protein BOTBODRAFT_147925 [Botryobasidium botryosum FD-172 SS1]|uniref:Uncharacterized protein n=1 Tax=Botryobasidium botryosum (strain FD-172 SS1) TaxID=930990 RepID=A0A067M2I0_BOTB1|nr:hypothetical protein BOTBODRAFT_147925 [Botryobasidium botryosum FD-172 SS1]
MDPPPASQITTLCLYPCKVAGFAYCTKRFCKAHCQQEEYFSKGTYLCVRKKHHLQEADRKKLQTKYPNAIRNNHLPSSGSTVSQNRDLSAHTQQLTTISGGNGEPAVNPTANITASDSQPSTTSYSNPPLPTAAPNATQENLTQLSAASQHEVVIDPALLVLNQSPLPVATQSSSQKKARKGAAADAQPALRQSYAVVCDSDMAAQYAASKAQAEAVRAAEELRQKLDKKCAQSIKVKWAHWEVKETRESCVARTFVVSVPTWPSFYLGGQEKMLKAVNEVGMGYCYALDLATGEWEEHDEATARKGLVSGGTFYYRSSDVQLEDLPDDFVDSISKALAEAGRKRSGQGQMYVESPRKVRRTSVAGWSARRIASDEFLSLTPSSSRAATPSTPTRSTSRPASRPTSHNASQLGANPFSAIHTIEEERPPAQPLDCPSDTTQAASSDMPQVSSRLPSSTSGAAPNSGTPSGWPGKTPALDVLNQLERLLTSVYGSRDEVSWAIGCAPPEKIHGRVEAFYAANGFSPKKQTLSSQERLFRTWSGDQVSRAKEMLALEPVSWSTFKRQAGIYLGSPESSPANSP